MDIADQLSLLRGAIVTHTYATGPGQELEKFLSERTKELVFIGHPLPYSEDTRTVFKHYVRGTLQEVRFGKTLRIPDLARYVKDVLSTWSWVYRVDRPLDFLIGANTLNAATGVWLRRARRVRTSILYSIDYIPYRFSNPLLNSLYHKLDKFCLMNCDYIWNLSSVMREAREARGIDIKNSAPQITVPEGVHFNETNRLSIDQIDRHKIVFLGHLRKYQGLGVLLNAMADVVKEIPMASLLIIGKGELEHEIRMQASQLGLQKHVTLTGYIESHKTIDEMMARCAIGVAPYEPDPLSYTFYTDSAKIKRYMVCGLPVITTAVASNSDLIAERHLGTVPAYNKKALASALIQFLKDDKLFRECRANAIDYASTIDWTNIFDRALSQSLFNSNSTADTH